MSQMGDISLVAQVVVFHNTRAFDQLVKKYQSPVRRFFLHQTCGDSELSDDLAQDTFIKAYTNIASFKNLSSFSTWLYRIAYNVFYDYIRSRKETDDLDTYRVDAQCSTLQQDVGQHMDIYRALATLKEMERTCITLFYMEDMAWSDDAEELKHIKNDVGSQLASMECVPRHNTIDCPTLYWAAMPGNAADFPAEESFHTFIEQAVCLFTEETNYRSSLSPFGIKMVDRLTGKPLHLDISDLPMKRGITTNRNKFVLGPSGSGKSFFMNHLVRQYYEQGTHVVLVDTGNSYQGLCEMIRCKTNGADGVYFTYTEEKPISFNPFYTDDYVFDVEKKDSIKTLLLTLWKSEDDKVTKTESGELGSAVNAYIERIRADRSIVPSFNTFYEYMRDDYRRELAEPYYVEIRVLIGHGFTPF